MANLGVKDGKGWSRADGDDCQCAALSGGAPLPRPREGRQDRIAVVRPPEALILVQLQEADGDALATAVAQGAQHGQVSAIADVDAEPVPRGGIAPGGVVLAVEEALHDPGRAAGGGAAEAGTPVAVILQVEDRAEGDVPTPSGLSPPWRRWA